MYDFHGIDYIHININKLMFTAEKPYTPHFFPSTSTSSRERQRSHNSIIHKQICFYLKWVKILQWKLATSKHYTYRRTVHINYSILRIIQQEPASSEMQLAKTSLLINDPTIYPLAGEHKVVAPYLYNLTIMYWVNLLYSHFLTNTTGLFPD